MSHRSSITDAANAPKSISNASANPDQMTVDWEAVAPFRAHTIASTSATATRNTIAMANTLIGSHGGSSAKAQRRSIASVSRSTGSTWAMSEHWSAVSVMAVTLVACDRGSQPNGDSPWIWLFACTPAVLGVLYGLLIVRHARRTRERSGEG